MRDPATRATFWRTYLDHPAWTAEPNVAHTAITRLDRGGIAVRVITQNIDGLHQRSGLAARKVLELHGTMHTTACTTCHDRLPTAALRARIANGETDPACRRCGGILKLDTVLFGERLDQVVMGQAVSIVSATPLLLAIGSSLMVEPAASLCRVAIDRGARLVIVNRDETPYDGIAAEVIRADITDAVPAIVDVLTNATMDTVR